MKTRHAGTCSRLPRGQYGCQSARPSKIKCLLCATPYATPGAVGPVLCGIRDRTKEERYHPARTRCALKPRDVTRGFAAAAATTSEERIRLVPRRCAVRSRCGPGESGVLYVLHNRTKATCKNSQIKRATAGRRPKRPRPACVVCRTAVLRWGARAAAAGPSAIGKNSGRSFARVAHSG